MKIAIISGIFFPHPGGAQIQVHNICNKITELGVNVDCYIYNKTQVTNNKYPIININKLLTSIVFFFYYYLRINLKFILRRYLSYLIKKKKYKVFHFIFLNFKSLFLIDCLKDLNQKVFVTFQGADIQIKKDINYGYRLNYKYDQYLKKVLPKIDKFFFLSQTVKKDLLNLKIKKEKLVFGPNSVYIKKFSEKIIKKRSNKIRLITVARYSDKKKGYDTLIKVAKKLIESNIDFEWKIIGKNTSKLLENKIINNNKNYFKIIENLENKNELYYPPSKLINYYLKSDIYINLSRIESFGITFIESLASKVPVVSLNTKGANEIIKNNYNGFILNNENEIFLKILKISNNINIIKRLNKNLIKSVLKYDLTLNAKNLIADYKK